MPKVKTVTALRGIMEYRFVPVDWQPPKNFEHVQWFAFDPITHADEYNRQREDIFARGDRLRVWNNREWDLPRAGSRTIRRSTRRESTFT